MRERGGTLASGARVEVVALYRYLEEARRASAPRAVAVVDQIRATSTAVTAFAVGAREIEPVETPDEARASRARDPEVLLAGELEAVRIPGFDLGNSPVELLRKAERLGGARIAMTTTNGMRALRAARSFSAPVYAFSLLNVSATAEALARTPAPGVILVVCAGTEGDLSQDDLFAAGALCDRLSGWGVAPSGDGARIALDVYSAWRGRELALFSLTRAGQNVIRASGSSEDLEFVAQTDRYRHLVRYRDGRLVKEELA